MLFTASLLRRHDAFEFYSAMRRMEAGIFDGEAGVLMLMYDVGTRQTESL